MLTAEVTFANAIANAEGVRQVAKASAFATYGYVAANLPAYITALVAADNAYDTAVTAAINTSGLLLGNLGYRDLIPNRIATLSS